ncbi:hypothetical protein [Caulobacter hibisci]|uniref:Polymerase nucleotidyl transferase domain-containing protein n=1 Tax=Caulobacter hibisci TaxID=2035993 RepID=A0ABS0SS36_9CAUL|nr:hypothetical protein [Caulobacter hibisci]MBI1682373.1 hypothetical protein [Caulobacter hibisci]
MGADLEDRFRPPAELRPAIRAFCERLIPPIQAAARAVGYAVAVHGSMERDLDLLAFPWTADAADELAAVEAIRLAVAEASGGRCLRNQEVGEKPHGRRSYTLLLFSDQCIESAAGCHPFIDLSVAPRVIR